MWFGSNKLFPPLYFSTLTSFEWFKNHSFADVALVIVSWVVNVLLAIINNTVSGLSSFNVSAKWVPSTLDTKWSFGPIANDLSASVTISGPKSEPPIPMLTTSVIPFPV